MNTRYMHKNAEQAAKAWRSLAAAKSQLDAALFMDEDQYQVSKAA
jgi:hypothetical protein